MLVLTRKLQERIQIGESITITVLRVKGRSVRIGIEAPRGVRVLRAELPLNEPHAGSSGDETGIWEDHPLSGAELLGTADGLVAGEFDRSEANDANHQDEGDDVAPTVSPEPATDRRAEDRRPIIGGGLASFRRSRRQPDVNRAAPRMTLATVSN